MHHVLQICRISKSHNSYAHNRSRVYCRPINYYADSAEQQVSEAYSRFRPNTYEMDYMRPFNYTKRYTPLACYILAGHTELVVLLSLRIMEYTRAP
jgi:hypothetical protein